MATYKIVKAEAESNTGRIITVWHVVDAADGFVIDAFSLKRDAADWIARTLAAEAAAK